MKQICFVEQVGDILFIDDLSEASEEERKAYYAGLEFGVNPLVARRHGLKRPMAHDLANMNISLSDIQDKISGSKSIRSDEQDDELLMKGLPTDKYAIRRAVGLGLAKSVRDRRQALKKYGDRLQ